MVCFKAISEGMLDLRPAICNSKVRRHNHHLDIVATKEVESLHCFFVLDGLTLISMGGHYGPPYSFSSISPERLELRPSNFLAFSFYLLAVRKI